MPRAGQIIPSHLYPHEAVYVNDNTQYTQVVASDADESINLLFVFASPMGPDNEVITIDGGFKQFISTFGQGPFSLYGQPYLNAYNAFKTGNIVGHCLRVTADNANYAYSVLVALYKIDEANNMTVKFKTRSSTMTLDDLDDMELLYESPTGVITDGDDEGFTEVKLMTIAAIGRGTYGRKLSYQISSNTGSDKENEYKNYIFSVYENFDSLIQKESYSVCFNENAIVDDSSLFTDGVINDPDSGSSRIRVLTHLEGFQEIIDAYNDANPESTFSIDDFDVLLGVNKYSRTTGIPNYTIDNTSDGVVVVNSTGGVSLEGGDDGDLGETVDTETRNQALEAAYLKAFTCETYPMIASKNKFPCNLILDANYPLDVKIAIAALTEKRGDCMCVLDCGTNIKSKASPITYVKNNLDSYARHRNEMIDAICGKVRDPYSKKLVTVTNTLLLAADYPNNWAEHNGKHVPLAGNNYGIITGFVKNSIYPVYDEDIDADIMDELCDERINFARINANQNVIRATQTTRQTISSNLSEASNVFVLLDIKRDCEKLCASYQYNFSEPEDIARFNKDAETVLSGYADSQIRSIEASFDKNDWEAERGILHLYVAFEHKDLVKTTIIEIDVNRGSSEA